MATANYKTQGDFPLLVYEAEAPEEEEVFGEVAESFFREFNNESRFYEIEIIGGYYGGIQTNINWIDKYFNKEDLLEINDEDADYYYGESARDVLAAIEDEEEKVRGILALIKKEVGFIEIKKVAQFSNGEAVYEEIKHNN